ncbi:MAG: hypothetical protein EOO68_06800 [Moraxellaceae bacterium]|nr:MAG: hypothetical protein EOO68_06800 [Moraxellaceae bacterium]
MSTARRIRQGMVTVATAAFLLSGCSQVIKGGASVALGFAERHIVPPIIAMDDADMACASGNATTPLVMSTKAMGADPAKMGVLLYTSAGICAENNSLAAELRYMRAAKANQIEEAKDARIEQKRWAEIAARRQYASYVLFAEHFQTKYKVKLGEQCPSMKTDLNKTIYLMGLLSGLQAVTNDINAGGTVNVPKDIAAVVERGMTCLDNEQFWGAPNAVRAAIWTLLPGADEGKPDPWQVMKNSAVIGEREGVRLPHALYVIAAQATGDETKIRDALRTYGRSLGEEKPVNKTYRLVDAIARQMIQNASDRYWTEHTGMRTPEDGYDHFWDESAVDDSGLSLDGLLDDAPADTTPDTKTATDTSTETDAEVDSTSADVEEEVAK